MALFLLYALIEWGFQRKVNAQFQCRSGLGRDPNVACDTLFAAEAAPTKSSKLSCAFYRKLRNSRAERFCGFEVAGGDTFDALIGVGL